MQLCDTNVVSELVRRRPNPGVLAWADGQVSIAISAVTVEEVAYGLAWRPVPRIADWFDRFLDRRCEVLVVTPEIARLGGQIRGRLQAEGETRTQADMLVAATARIHRLTLVTRNVRDFADCGVTVLNPFT